MGSASLASSAFLVPFPFFLLSHLAIISAEEEFPGCHPFSCGNLNFSYPFSNHTHLGCGLSTIRCEPEKVPILEAEEGRHYEVKATIEVNKTVVIHDAQLFESLKGGRCDGIYNFSTSIFFPTLSFKLNTLELTFLKCNKDFNIPPQLAASAGNYPHCHDYNLFYYINSEQSLPPALPTALDDCSVYYFPVLPPSDGNWTASKLLPLFEKGFSLEWSNPPECHHCETCRREWNGDLKECKGDKKMKIRPILGIATGIELMVTVIVLICCLRSKISSHNLPVVLKKETKDDHKVEAFFKNYGSLAPKRFTYSDIKKMTDSFKDKLGQGGYGSVYKGKLLNNQLVAVKVLSESKGNGEEFINEVASISRTSHVNIVTLLGFCFEGRKRALIYEFMPNGSLEKLIYDQNSLDAHPILGWERLHKISIGIARGLEYLHRGCNTSILHFDIKPHNILLDQDFCPKISDFGLAKLCPNKESIISMTGARGTIGYIAPEVFCRNFGGVSHKSDVYSYGMMVLEMVGGRKNIDVGVGRTSEIYFPHWIYKRLKQDEDLGLHGLITRVEEEMARKMTLVGLWCIQTDPLNRPSMSTVVEMLEGNIDSLQIPPKPYLSSPPRSPEVSPTTCESSLITSMS